MKLSGLGSRNAKSIHGFLAPARENCASRLSNLEQKFGYDPDGMSSQIAWWPCFPPVHNEIRPSNARHAA